MVQAYKVKHKAHHIDVLVGKNLRRYRILNGLSQMQLAQSAGITFQQVQKYENGMNRISASRLYTFAQTLEISINAFYEGLGLQDKETDPFYLDKNTLRMLALFKKIKNEDVKKSLINLLKSYKK